MTSSKRKAWDQAMRDAGVSVIPGESPLRNKKHTTRSSFNKNEKRRKIHHRQSNKDDIGDEIKIRKRARVERLQLTNVWDPLDSLEASELKNGEGEDDEYSKSDTSSSEDISDGDSIGDNGTDSDHGNHHHKSNRGGNSSSNGGGTNKKKLKKNSTKKSDGKKKSSMQIIPTTATSSNSSSISPRPHTATTTTPRSTSSTTPRPSSTNPSNVVGNQSGTIQTLAELLILHGTEQDYEWIDATVKPSIYPSRKVCDATGKWAKYCDPATGLNYTDRRAYSLLCEQQPLWYKNTAPVTPFHDAMEYLISNRNNTINKKS
jgi:hypothetical protein